MHGRAVQIVALLVAVLGITAGARGQGPAPPLAMPPEPTEAPETEPTVKRVPFDDLGVAPASFDLPFSINTGMPQRDPQADQGTDQKLYPLTDLALFSNDYVDPRYVNNSQFPDEPGIWERTRGGYHEQVIRFCDDVKRFYWSENLLYVGLSIGIAAPLANTDADRRIRDNYQRRAGGGSNGGVDNLADAFRYVGEYQYAIPAYLAFSLSGYLWPDNVLFTPLGEFGNRSLRAIAVGAPTVGILQVGLGGKGPTGSSRWNPLDGSRGVSSQAFLGAVPFLTAASMCENRVGKVVLFVGSFGSSWAAIHQDRNYFSQVLLGWSIAYLSVEAVNYTEEQARLRILPVVTPEGVGMMMHLQY